MERYEAYKDSGVRCIGEIPQGWHLAKTLYGLSMPITDGPHETPAFHEEGIPFVSAEAVSCGNGLVDFEHIRGFVSDEYYNECCKKYKPAMNDIYMIKSGATTGRVAIVDTDRPFAIWSPLAVFRCDKVHLCPKYLFYYLQSEGYQRQVVDSWTFGTQQNIGMRTLERLLVCYPSLFEQRAIADYLDAKTAEIDALVADCEREVGLLREYRKAVISEAVTKGLDPDAPMKDSGVEWIGWQPSSWKYLKLGYVFDRLFDIDHWMPEFADEGYPYLMIGDLEDLTSRIDFESCKHISEQDYIGLSAKGAPKRGDVIIARYATIGTGCYVDTDEPFVVTYACLTVTPRSEALRGRYLLYYTQSEVFARELLTLTNSNTQGNVGKDSLSKAQILLPSIEEQDAIVSVLDNRTAEIDSLIEAKQTMADKLREYRKSLISEAVTGKFKVPGV